MEEKKEGTEKELLQYLVQENIMLHAQFRALKTVFKLLFIGLMPEDQRSDSDSAKFEEIYLKKVRYFVEQLIVSHPLMEDTWKSSIQEALRDVPGLDLS